MRAKDNQHPPSCDAYIPDRGLEALFDHITDTVYFIKDRTGRYTSVNQTLVERCDCGSKSDLIGRRADDIFPPPMGKLISEQDSNVIRTGTGIQARLELHLHAKRREGWCLTWKEPLRNAAGDICGLSGISRDVKTDQAPTTDHAQLAIVLDHIHAQFHQPLRASDLADLAGLSSYQLERRVRFLMGLTLGQYIIRVRIDHACHRLRQTEDAISLIALDCGYADQAAFSRQFRRSVKLSPSNYRERYKTSASRPSVERPGKR